MANRNTTFDSNTRNSFFNIHDIINKNKKSFMSHGHSFNNTNDIIIPKENRRNNINNRISINEDSESEELKEEENPLMNEN